MSGQGRSRTAVVQGFFCVLQSAQKIAKRMKKGTYRITPNGLEKRCPKCIEFWPADTEFYFPSSSSSDGLHCWCKACYMDTRYPNGRKAVALELAA